jgi:hypothetical protein
VLDRKLEEGSLQLIAVRELGEIVARLLPFDRELRQLERTPARAPDVVMAGVHEEAVEPGVERVRVAQTLDVAPGSDEGVLDGILRGIPIAQDPPRDRVQAVVRGGREGIEGLVIAPLCAFDEFGRHRRPLGCGAVICRTHRLRTPARAQVFRERPRSS